VGGHIVGDPRRGLAPGATNSGSPPAGPARPADRSPSGPSRRPRSPSAARRPAWRRRPPCAPTATAMARFFSIRITAAGIALALSHGGDASGLAPSGGEPLGAAAGGLQAHRLAEHLQHHARIERGSPPEARRSARRSSRPARGRRRRLPAVGAGEGAVATISPPRAGRAAATRRAGAAAVDLQGGRQVPADLQAVAVGQGLCAGGRAAERDSSSPVFRRLWSPWGGRLAGGPRPGAISASQITGADPRIDLVLEPRAVEHAR